MNLGLLVMLHALVAPRIVAIASLDLAELVDSFDNVTSSTLKIRCLSRRAQNTDDMGLFPPAEGSSEFFQLFVGEVDR